MMFSAFRCQQLLHLAHRNTSCLGHVRQHYVERRFFSSDLSGAFADRVVLRVTGGRGGSGCASFARGPNQEIAPPDGGHGGDGGSVWIEADIECRSLRQSTTLVRGKHGTNGRGAKQRGHNGEDVVVNVPCGTVVSEFGSGAGVANTKTGHDNGKVDRQAKNGNNNNNADTTDGKSEDSSPMDDMLKSLGGTSHSGGTMSIQVDGSTSDGIEELDRAIARLKWEIDLEDKGIDPSTMTYPDPHKKSPTHPEKTLVVELNEDGQRVLVAAGGRGGRGNMSFKNSTNRSPIESETGTLGEERRLELELKTIADIGLVGFPNAGKSTFLRAISRAKPRVAAYPFTTLRPHIGMVYPDPNSTLNPISVADIPGLIEGAHEDKGLGHDFLRHIERTKLLAYVVDVSQGPQKATQALEVLAQELELYLPGLAKRASCIVANKMDIKSEQARDGLIALVERAAEETLVFPVSAKYGTGVDEVIEFLSGKFGCSRT